MIDLIKRFIDKVNNFHIVPVSTNKVYTFSITYKTLEGSIDNIEFCAITRAEAIHLFEHYCKYDLKLPITLYILKVCTVYNKEDAEYYGDTYATPEEYLEYLL